MTTLQEITATGVDAQGRIDKYLSKAWEAALQNVTVTEEGVAAGMVKAIKGKQMINHARKVAGLIAEAAYEAALLHADQTAACVANDCDTGKLTSVAGVSLLADSSEGTVTTLSGGDR
ncbi:hypothetical protein [Allorhizobium ampelinum]|uniref:hypothetical protein n=1 Tax=Allorhizobium ampelinum TaxID=3025782 RepID=UPI000B3FA1EA|nr:hypothetical protein [Allorhizobium ampelinum]NTA27378.1 hypothetical protein [Allorhizobium ampelinum]OVE94434.1 hypothetical protein B7W85_12855 [Allorhizobium ampelinum]